MSIRTDITFMANRLEQTVVRTSGLTASWEECGDADNIKIKRIFF